VPPVLHFDEKVVLTHDFVHQFLNHLSEDKIEVFNIFLNPPKPFFYYVMRIQIAKKIVFSPNELRSIPPWGQTTIIYPGFSLVLIVHLLMLNYFDATNPWVLSM